MIYAINYDLKRPGQNYEELREAIKSCGDCSFDFRPLQITIYGAAGRRARSCATVRHMLLTQQGATEALTVEPSRIQ